MNEFPGRHEEITQRLFLFLKTIYEANLRFLPRSCGQSALSLDSMLLQRQFVRLYLTQVEPTQEDSLGEVLRFYFFFNFEGNCAPQMKAGEVR